MADNFGPRQNRVLEVAGRNLDNVVFQYRTPPLSSEWNLINQISNDKTQQALKVSCPSGWYSVGDILQDWSESSAQTGQVITSETYAANSFKLMSLDDNVAVVNGWPIIVKGSNSSNDNNIITLEAPAGQKFDFVFLEVWRKLVAADDPIYPYGNVTQNPFSDNEIEWDAIGAETTKRVQIQYRIRTKSIFSDISPDSNVFTDQDVHPIGGRTSGEYTFLEFAPYGPSDIGLYVAGTGSVDDQEMLNTVDGYVYAIPMFVVARRNKTTQIFNVSQINNASVGLAELDDGDRRDRPDGRLADAIYADDIVDYRHKILTSGKDLNDTVKKSMNKLMAGELTTALKKAFGANGATTNAYSGGSVLMKAERLNSTGGDDIPSIGSGSSTASTAFKRRAFSNAMVEHKHNVIEIPCPGSTWQDGDTVDLTTTLTLPAGEIISIDGFYSPTLGVVTGVSATGVTEVVVTSSGGNSLVGLSDVLLMQFTFRYNSSTSGFKDVPNEFLEASKGTFQQIATRDRDVLVRFNDSGELLNFGTNPNNGETEINDRVHYEGGSYTDNTRFGHDLIIHRSLNAFSKVTIGLTDSKLNGYYVLGVKALQVEDSGVFGDPIDFNVERNVTVTPTSYVIDEYIITANPASAGKNVMITLITGSKSIRDVTSSYDVADSMKFFELSKQGRGVIDTFEMIEVIAENDGDPEDFSFDTVDKPIIALATKSRTESSSIEGYAFAFKFEDDGVSLSIASAGTINRSLPVLSESQYTDDLLPTKMKVRVPAAAGETKIRIPVLVHSYVTSAEDPYEFFYKMAPYQGLLTTGSAYRGRFEALGPAVITTLGSGSAANFRYNEGEATFIDDERVVTGSAAPGGVAPSWLQFVKPGDYINTGPGTSWYRILSVDGETELTLAERHVGAYSGAYEIMRLDVPQDNISNVVDRFPSLALLDHKCYSDLVEYADFEASLTNVQPLLEVHDPLQAIPNDFVLGDSVAKRGRNDLVLSINGNGAYKLGINGKPRPQILYKSLDTELPEGHAKKVYQAYLFNRSAKGFLSEGTDETGRMYLLVISGETPDPIRNLLNNFSNADTVDVYELDGRPIVKMD